MAKFGIKTNEKALNKALTKYANRFKVDLGQMVRYVAVGLIADVAEKNPVKLGQSRAAWLPFLFSQQQTAELKSASGVDATKARQKQREGLRQEKHRYKFKDTWKPFATIINRVKHTVYLEYGTKKMPEGSKRKKKGFVRDSMKAWDTKLSQALKSGKRLKLR